MSESRGFDWNTLAFSFIFLLASVSFLDSFFDGARYIKYVAPIAVIFIWLALASNEGKFKLYLLDEIKPFLFLLIYFAFTLVMNYEFEGVKDILFIFVYTCPFLFLGRLKNTYIVDKFFYLVTCLYIGKIALSQISSFSILDSSGVLEGTESFLFGAFFLYFISRGDRLLALTAFILVLLSLKRIALLGMMIGFLIIQFRFILYVLPLRTVKVCFFIVLTVALIFIYNFASGNFDYFLSEFFGVSTNYLSMGRSNIHGYVIESSDIGFFQSVFGTGIGQVYKFVDEATMGNDKNLHSDLLKIYIEGGIVGFFIFSFLWARTIRFDNVQYHLYLLCLFLTDNVLIYPQVIIFLLVFICVYKEVDDV